MSDTFDKKRIVKNSSALYIRMMFTMILNLLTTRFVLSALGVEDMGIYGVVGSIVGMFTFLANGLYSAVQRFITFEMGKAEGDVSKVFSTCSNMLYLVALVLLVLLELGGNVMLAFFVNIPEKYDVVSQWVLQFSILTCIINICTTSYNSLIMAKERMTVWAFITAFQVVLNCAFALGLTKLITDDRLLLYAIGCMSIQFLILFIYFLYCKRYIREVRYSLAIDRQLAKEISQFAGANVVSSLLQMVTSQGLVLIINWTFGVAVNAVFNIAMQVKNSVQSFGMNIFKAVMPQITKTYASGEIERHKKLVYSGSKMGVFMILLVLIPFIIRSQYIMQLWLGTVPMYATAFASALIFQSLIYAGFEPFRAAVFATGRVSKFLIYSEVFNLVLLPVSYLGATLASTPIPFVIIIALWQFVFCGYMVFLGTRVSVFSVRELTKKVMLPCFLVMTLSFLTSYGIAMCIPNNFIGLIAVCIVSSILIFVFIFLLGLSKEEMNIVKKGYETIRMRLRSKRSF